jgi:hypothetical protein
VILPGIRLGTRGTKLATRQTTRAIRLGTLGALPGIRRVTLGIPPEMRGTRPVKGYAMPGMPLAREHVTRLARFAKGLATCVKAFGTLPARYGKGPATFGTACVIRGELSVPRVPARPISASGSAALVTGGW